MVNKIIHVIRNVNLRQDVCDLVEGECAIRRNGERGFSLTINQIILEYFDMRTPKNMTVTIVDGRPALTIETSKPLSEEGLKVTQAKYNALNSSMERTQLLLKIFGRYGLHLQKYFEINDIGLLIEEISKDNILSKEQPA